MKNKIYFVNLNIIEEKVKTIFEMPEEIGFIDRFGLLSGLRKQEIRTLNNKRFVIVDIGDCHSLHKIDSRNQRLTILTI